MSNKFLKAADNAKRELILGVGLARTRHKCSHFQERLGEFQHFPMVTMTASQLAQSCPILPLFYMYSVRKHHQRYLKYIQYSEWVSVPCVEKKIPEWQCAEWGMFQTWFFRVEEGRNIRTNVTVCVSCLGILGHPFPPFFPFLNPSIRPSSLRVWWQHEELEIMNTTTLTHRPHSTRVYYHTTIFQPNTVNRESKGFKQGSGAGAKGERGQRGRGGRQQEMKDILTYAYVCDRCLHDTTTDNHHTTFSLSSKPSNHWKVLGADKQRGPLRKWGRPVSVKRTSCSLSKRKMAVFKRNKKKRPICSSILARPHESLRTAHLFILAQKQPFHHLPQGATTWFEGFVLQKFVCVILSPAWGRSRSLS